MIKIFKNAMVTLRVKYTAVTYDYVTHFIKMYIIFFVLMNTSLNISPNTNYSKPLLDPLNT